MGDKTGMSVDILNESELDALAHSSGDDCDMASVECVVREVRALRHQLAAAQAECERMRAVYEAAMRWAEARDHIAINLWSAREIDLKHALARSTPQDPK